MQLEYEANFYAYFQQKLIESLVSFVSNNAVPLIE